MRTRSLQPENMPELQNRSHDLLKRSAFILWFFCLAAICFFPVVPCSACPGNAFSVVIPSPLVEVKKYVAQWAAANGFRLEEQAAGIQGYRLLIEDKRYILTLCLMPDSPLATQISLDQGNGRTNKGKNILSEIVQFVKSRQKHACKSGQPCGSFPPPFFLIKYKNIVVCIMIYKDHESVQSSGIYLTGLQAVLTTAHEVENVKHIVCTSQNGTEFDGNLVYIDKRMDMALIKINNFPGLAVPVWKRKKIFRQGEQVFSIGCPLNAGISLMSGTVDYPRNMDGVVLWQVNMEVEPGSSGSPVFDSKGYFAGVIKGRYRGVEGKGFIISINSVKDFIEHYRTR